MQKQKSEKSATLFTRTISGPALATLFVWQLHFSCAVSFCSYSMIGFSPKISEISPCPNFGTNAMHDSQDGLRIIGDFTKTLEHGIKVLRLIPKADKRGLADNPTVTDSRTMESSIPGFNPTSAARRRRMHTFYKGFGAH